MSFFALGDTHLSLGVAKEMDIFGGNWVGYMDKLEESLSLLTPEDTLLVCGDLGWGMSLEQSLADFAFLAQMPPGRIILLKGNHDYWWTSLQKMEGFFRENSMEKFVFLHNNCQFYDDIAICGTRGWFYEVDRGEHSAKIFNRELMRLETSLKQAGDKEKYCFLHYPPITKQYRCDQIIELLKKYQVTRCFFGHLHGKQHHTAVEGRVEGIEFRLISADFLDCKPMKII